MSSLAPARLGDEDVRERAVRELRQSFIMQAPAGAGKTELLARRFLALLAQVDDPGEIRALTFTRKAAGEMRERVLKALRDAETDAPVAAHEQLTRELARGALARDAQRGWRLLEAPQRLRLGTIDSFCAELAAGMPWLSRCGPRPQPLEDADELYLAAARATLDLLDTSHRISRPLGRVLEYYHGKQASLENQIARMLAVREQWLPQVVSAGAELPNQTNAAVARLRQAARADAARTLAECPQARDLLALLRECAHQEGSTASIQACRDLTRIPGSGEEAMPAWLGMAAWLLKSDGGRRTRGATKEGFPNGAKQLKDRFAKLEVSEAFLSALRELPGLPAPLTPEQGSVLLAMAEVLTHAAAELTVQFRERGAMDFTAIQLGAREALGAAGDPSALAYALDFRLRHVLIDEFQDTSPAQYALLAALLDNWEPNDGRTVFIVGDPMQSIFGFRNADVRLFHRAAREGLGGVRLQPLRLTTNFRSRPELIHWFNRVFEPSFREAGLDEYVAMQPAPPPAASAAGGGQAAGGAAAAARPARAANACEVRIEESAVREAVRVASAAEAGSGDVAILARSRGHLHALLPELERRGADFEAFRVFGLDESPVIQDLLALTRALLRPGDRIAWLALLRAPWCGLTLAELHQLCAGAGGEAGIWELLQDDERVARVGDPGRRRLAWFRETLAPVLFARGRLRPRVLVAWAWRRLGGPLCARPGAESHAGEFFELLERVSDGGDPGELDALAERAGKLRQGRGAKPGLDRIAVLTMHTAKGLEFDRVILPQLARRDPVADPRPLYWDEFEFEEGRYPIFAPPAEAGQERSLAAYLRSRAARRVRQEQLRLLYVAATRARERLNLVCALAPGELPHPNSPLARIWNAIENECVRDPAANAGEEPRREPPLLRRVAPDWRPPEPTPMAPVAAAAEPVTAFESQNAGWRAAPLARQVGAAVHRMLYRLASGGSLDWSAATLDRELAAAGVGPGEMKRARERAIQALERVRASERGRWILAPRPEARSEYPLTGVVGGQLRNAVIDRCFRDEAGVRWVIDYKTATHEGAGLEAFLDEQERYYREQLDAYAVLYGDGGELVRRGLYFPLLDAWREWGPEESQ